MAVGPALIAVDVNESSEAQFTLLQLDALLLALRVGACCALVGAQFCREKCQTRVRKRESEGVESNGDRS